jgi:hypothetical protein
VHQKERGKVSLFLEFFTMELGGDLEWGLVVGELGIRPTGQSTVTQQLFKYTNYVMVYIILPISMQDMETFTYIRVKSGRRKPQ